MTDLDRLLEIYIDLLNKIDSPYGFTDEELKEIQSLKSQLESKLAEKRLTDNMVKIVVCIKCNRHRTPYGYYPKTQCICGSYESEERDTTLEELFRIDSQHTNLVKAIQDVIHQDITVYQESLQTVEKIQFGKELDKFDSANLQYTIEDLLERIIKNYPQLQNLLERANTTECRICSCWKFDNKENCEAYCNCKCHKSERAKA